MKEAERAVGLEQGAAATSCPNLTSVLQQQEAVLNCIYSSKYGGSAVYIFILTCITK